MAHEVIMPALGMAQETGVLVRWLAAPGDRVEKGQPLIEVETDKAVQEVEAQASGVLGAVTAEAGDEIPVGQVIGLILAEGEAAEARPAPAAETVVPEAAGVPDTPVAAPVQPSAPVVASGPAGRILASPKARRLAAAEGLDLARLAEAGHPQPFHAKDLEVLRGMATLAGPVAQGAPVAQASGAALTAPSCGRIDAMCDAAPLALLIARFAEDAKVTLTPAAFLARFAAQAWRAATGTEAPIVVAVERLEGAAFAPAAHYVDPDRQRLTAGPVPADAPPTLILRDLTDSPLTAIHPAEAPAVPILTVGRPFGQDAFALGLCYAAEQVKIDAAVAVVTHVAGALADPLVHLA